MNKSLLAILSAVVLLNTACSPKQDETVNNPIQSSVATASSTAAVGTAAVDTAATPTEQITPAETPAPTSGELLDTYWKLIYLNDKEVVSNENQQEPHLIFTAENRVSGSDGCNRLTGTFLLDNDKLTLGELASTRMACVNGAEQSQAFNEALTKVAAYSLHADQLELRDGTGLVIARFKAAALP